MKASDLYVWAWKAVPKLPPNFVASVGGGIGRVVALANGRGVRQLRKNLRYLTGKEPTRRDVSRATASYFRCFAQQLSMSGWKPQYLRTSCVYDKAAQTRKLMETGPVILALTHTGNWDLAGAWFCQGYGSIVTVAEKLNPPELFDSFVAFRNSIGMEVLGVQPGEKIFERLAQTVKDRSVLVPLLSDRDISGSGVKVKLGQSEAIVAAGPAALALRLNRPLIAGTIRYVKIGRRWTIKSSFTDPIPVPQPDPGETLVEAYTRAWVKETEPRLIRDALDWHMMQKLYVDDLDPERLARAEERHKQSREGSET